MIFEMTMTNIMGRRRLTSPVTSTTIIESEMVMRVTPAAHKRCKRCHRSDEMQNEVVGGEGGKGEPKGEVNGEVVRQAEVRRAERMTGERS